MALSAENSAASAANVFREAVCIDTNRIYDACSDRDCIRGMQVAFTTAGQPIIDAATTLKARCAEVIGVFFEVEPVPFNRGFYSVDMTYFFKVYVSAYTTPTGAPTPVEGLVTYCKKVILFGSEASVRTFSTTDPQPSSTGLPVVNVQVIDPMILACEVCDCAGTNTRTLGIPESIAEQFAGSFEDVAYSRCLTLTMGLFSIVQLERRVQVMVPIYDFCIPDNKSCTPKAADPCELFGQIAFPLEEFFPPKLCDMGEE